MENVSSKPEVISKLRFAVDGGLAMLAGMQLDLFTPLKKGPMTADELAAAIGVNHGRLRLLLYVLVAAELLTQADGRFTNTEEANKYLVKGEPSYMGNRHAAIGMRWRQNFATAESIRRGAPSGKLDFSNASPEALETFLRNINATAAPSARGLVESADFSSIKTLLDVGCGGGGMSITITKLCPHLTATAVDLASVTPITQKIVSEEGAAERVKVLAADGVKGPLPGSYDAAVLKSFLQVLSAKDARCAIQNVYDALNPGGRLFIIGQILDDSRLSPLDAVAFNLAFINFFDSGESYTDGEHREWLTGAGFVDIERSPLTDAGSLMTARKHNVSRPRGNRRLLRCPIPLLLATLSPSLMRLRSDCVNRWQLFKFRTLQAFRSFGPEHHFDSRDSSLARSRWRSNVLRPRSRFL